MLDLPAHFDEFLGPSHNEILAVLDVCHVARAKPPFLVLCVSTALVAQEQARTADPQLAGAFILTHDITLVIDQTDLISRQPSADAARIAALTIAMLEGDAHLRHAPELTGRRVGMQVAAEVLDGLGVDGGASDAHIAQRAEIVGHGHGGLVDRVDDGGHQVGLGDTVLAHSREELVHLETRQDEERVAVSHGEQVGPQGAEEMEHGQGHETTDRVGHVVLDGAVVGHDRMVREDGGLGETTRAAGRKHGCRRGLDRAGIIEDGPVALPVADQVGEVEVPCVLAGHADVVPGWVSQLVRQEELRAIVDRAFVHQAHLAGMDAASGSHLVHHGQRIARGEDQLGVGEADDVVQFLRLATWVGAHIDTTGADNAEE